MGLSLSVSSWPRRAGLIELNARDVGKGSQKDTRNLLLPAGKHGVKVILPKSVT